MEQVRLIALDLDGTLLDDRKEVPPENISALEEAQGRGILVAISSGRMIPRILPVEERLGLDCIILAYNGGKVVGPKSEGRPLISERPLPADIAEIFIRFSREGDYLLNFYHDDVLYSEDSPNRRRFMEIYSGRTGAEYHIEDLSGRIGQEPTKLILLAEPGERDRLHDRFTAELGDRAYITKSDPEYLEIMARAPRLKPSASTMASACRTFWRSETLKMTIPCWRPRESGWSWPTAPLPVRRSRIT